MQVAARIGTMARRGTPLPYLRRVAYLESHGTEWIDTGFVASSETSIKCEFMLVVSNGGDCLFGGRNTYDDRSFFIWTDVTGNSRFDYSSESADNVFGPNVPLDTRIILEKIKNKNFVNSVETVANSVKSFVCAQTSYLFAGNDGGTAKFFSRAKIYDAKIVDGDNSIHLIPVLDLSGRPAMYDEVIGQFFYNQGTGEFTFGELNATSALSSSMGVWGGWGWRYNLLCVRRSYRRSSQPSARFCAHSQEWEVAA